VGTCLDELLLLRQFIVEEMDGIRLRQKRQNVFRPDAIARHLPRFLVLCRGVARNEHVFIVSLVELIEQRLLFVVVPRSRLVSKILESRVKRVALCESERDLFVPLKPDGNRGHEACV